ncbi:hypothetical protein [Shinella sp. BYT-45]|uniref:hypothetical protein n=1 Tax=Shinella sp. BYT-45 TaxID=3377377 RepID=UPI00398043C8
MRDFFPHGGAIALRMGGPIVLRLAVSMLVRSHRSPPSADFSAAIGSYRLLKILSTRIALQRVLKEAASIDSDRFWKCAGDLEIE